MKVNMCPKTDKVANEQKEQREKLVVELQLWLAEKKTPIALKCMQKSKEKNNKEEIRNINFKKLIIIQ